MTSLALRAISPFRGDFGKQRFRLPLEASTPSKEPFDEKRCFLHGRSWLEPVCPVEPSASEARTAGRIGVGKEPARGSVPTTP